MYIIWDKKIWGAYSASQGWRPYVGASEHTDHIHFSFSWAGAMAHTSWWTGRVAATDYGPCVTVTGQPAAPYRTPNPKPCAAPAKGTSSGSTVYASYGDQDAHVLALQKKLKVTPATGYFGPITRAAVMAYQKAHHLTATGVVSTDLARTLGLVTTPKPPAKPAPKKTVSIIARPGDRSALVVKLQRLLKVTPTSGLYGPKTTAAVARFQQAHRLPPSGILDAVTAHRIGLVA